MIVADVNLLIYLSIEYPASRLARLWAEADPVWFVPDVWRFEFANAMVTHTRTGKIVREEAVEILGNAIKAFSVNQVQVDQSEVFHAAMRYRISAYDANYVVLAEMLNAFCVTADRQMLERVPKLTRDLQRLHG